MRNINSIGVCGAGTMGSGIAQVFAQHDFAVILFDVNREVLHLAQSRIDSSLQQLVGKQKISAARKAEILSAIRFTDNVNECVADLVVEAVVEKADIKIELLRQIVSINSPDTILCTNTSSLAVTDLAEQLNARERFAGMHFFNPAPVMKLVEVVKTKYTDDDTIAKISEIAKRIGKTPVVCSDSPGFIVNRVARPFYLEALYLAENNDVPFALIDQVMEASGFRMGPFALMDLIGNDINYSVSTIVYDALGKPERLKPSSLQKEKVTEGSLGRKTGKGYYDYPAR